MRTFVSVVMIVLASFALPALAGEPPTVPLEWQGVWSFTTTTRIPCEIGTPMQIAGMDTLCAGEPAFQPSGFDSDCTGSADADSYVLDCTWQTVEDDCTISFVYHAEGTRSGEMYTAEGTSMATADDPKACGFDEFCTEFATTATRISTDPEDCKKIPVETRSWGRVKAQYR